jgi:hypothetical protein
MRNNIKMAKTELTLKPRQLSVQCPFENCYY